MKSQLMFVSLVFLGCASTASGTAVHAQEGNGASEKLVFGETTAVQSTVAQIATSPVNVGADPDVPGYTAIPPGAPQPPATAWGILPTGTHPRAAVWRRPPTPRYYAVVRKVANMLRDSWTQREVQRRGLHLVNVAWEDTGRSQGSVLGPNISDVTLQVRYRDRRNGSFREALMPVIRYPNYTDKTGDIPSGRFFVRVGNHRGGSLHSVALTEVLRHLKRYASLPSSILGSGNMLAPRDTHFLASAQAVFLPVPRNGKAEFNPVVFNYQSAPGSPAVLTLLVTRQGTSIEVIENKSRDRTLGGGQELYFNNHGQRAAFTAERRSDVKARIEQHGGPATSEEKSALEQGADCMFLVQVPLRHRNRGVLPGLGGGAAEVAKKSAAMPMSAAGQAPMPARRGRGRSDVERAVLGHGPNLGMYREGSGLRLVRDTRFPIRITVQFYKATSNGVVSEHDLDKVASVIGNVYEHADYVGSLVVPPGDPARPTAWHHMPGDWFAW